MIDRMRDGIRPLCDHHYAPMRLQELETSGLTWLAYVCAEPGCNRAYTSARGYFGLVGSQTIALEKDSGDCHRCEYPMFAESVSTSDGKEVWVWRRAQVGCNYSVELSPLSGTP
jgi:hypothetical protein